MAIDEQSAGRTRVKSSYLIFFFLNFYICILYLVFTKLSSIIFKFVEIKYKVNKERLR